MHAVVLLLHVVEMLGVLVDRVASEDALQQQKRVEVLVGPARCIVKDSDARVDHLVVADHQKARVENCLFKAIDRFGVLSLQVTKMLLAEVNQHLMLNFTGAHNHDVLAEVVGLVEVDHHVARDALDVIDVAQNWLAHHVLSENVVVHILHQRFL